jgi:type IX secretion system PorP/SprF family membrane protein
MPYPNRSDLARLIFCLVALLGSGRLAQAQDPQFTQFYASPLYMNPAFAGATPHFRFSAIYRNQWPNVPGAYQAFQAGLDYNWDYYDSGVGVLLSQNRVGGPRLVNTAANFFYSYQIRINQSWAARLGLNAGIGFTSIDLSRLTFEDQLLTGGPTAEALAQRPLISPHFSFGGTVYSRQFWFGAAAHNLLRPPASFLSPDERQPYRFTVQTGVKLPLDGQGSDSKVSLSPAALYQAQGIYDQLDLGVNFFYEPVIMGIWYRGIPIQRNIRGNPNHDMLAGLVGLKFGNWTVSYSYDITFSTLNNSGGAHEVSLVYAPAYDQRRKRGTKHIVCPMNF